MTTAAGSSMPLLNHVKQHIHKEFKSATNHEERQELISYILYLGLRHYHLIYPNQPVLRRLAVALCEKAILEQDHIQNYQVQRGVKITLPQAQYEVPHPEHDALHNVRKSRPDAMFHYPFTDEYGSVVDVLSQEYQQERPDLLKISGPGRKRVIEKTFEEMRLDRQGIRLSDLPEALSRIGIELAPRLKKLLEKTRSNVVNGPLVMDEDDSHDHGYINPIMNQYMEKHIPLALWKAIVKNFLIMRKQGMEPKEITQLIPLPRSQRAVSSRHSDDGSTSYYDEEQVDREDYFESLEPMQEEDDEEEEEQAWEETKRANSRRHARPTHHKKHSKQQEEDEDDNEDDFFLNRMQPTPRMRKAKKLSKQELEEQQREQAKKELSKQSQQYQKQLKQVPSRIKDIIRHDKSHFQHHQQVTNTNALASLAKKRVDILTSTHPSSFRDPNYFTEADPSRAKKPAVNQYKKISSLDSGTAALEIADAFLHGTVGKELMITSESDFDGRDDYEMGPKDAMKEVSRMLGMKSRGSSAANANRSASNHQATKASSSNKTAVEKGHATTSSNTTSFSHKTVKEKTVEKMLDEQSKHLYASGWKAGKNGWVADFGPAHTQALYTGPERAQDASWRKSTAAFKTDHTTTGSALPMTQTDLLKTLTNKDRMKFAAATTTATSSSTSKAQSAYFPERAVEHMDYNDVDGDEEDLVKLREEYKLPSKQTSSTFGKTLYNAMEPGSEEDSTSLDPAIAGAGAGASTGLYEDEESYGGDSFAHKYYDTVSLKDMAGSS